MLVPNATEQQDIVVAIFGEAARQLANTDRLQAFLRHYCSLVCPVTEGDAAITVDTPVLGTHADVVRCIRILTQDPKLSFDGFITKAVGSHQVSLKEKGYIARVTVEAVFAVDCLLRDHYSDGYKIDKLGGRRAKWEGGISLEQFMKDAFAQAPQLGSSGTNLFKNKKALKAWKLRKRYGIKLRPTNNLLEHLSFNQSTMVLKVFHQVAFLRAHLEKTKNQPLDLSFEESLKLGTLPPKLLLETLLTFHDILFPLATSGERRSLRLMDKMIDKHGFDPEGKWVGFVRPKPPNSEFEYWGNRLATLYDLVKKPPPTNAFISWFDRHTTERNALTVAIVGLFLSALFGLLGVLVGVVQVVLAWFAWKHPA